MGQPNEVFGAGGTPLITSAAIWNWDTSGSVPVVSGFPVAGGFGPTKSGILPNDVQQAVGIPLQYFGNPPTPVPSTQILGWIRMAEDQIEQQTSLLLCQTWVAAKPAFDPLTCASIGVIPTSPTGYQVRGYDYDLEDASYDFIFNRAQDEGWMVQQTRYRPLQSFSYTPSNETATKNAAYVYPLLNTFFRVPPSWFVEDKDYGLIRFVPAQNVQMLPLFAMQLAFMGFAENVPGAIWLQYTAGLTPYDYQTRYSFMQRLVVVAAAIMALRAIQPSINMGLKAMDTSVDGLRQRFEYDVAGTLNGPIKAFEAEYKDLLKQAKDFVNGPVMTMI